MSHDSNVFTSVFGTSFLYFTQVGVCCLKYLDKYELSIEHNTECCRRQQILTVENVLQGIYRNNSGHEKQITVEKLDEDEQDKQKWLCLL